MKKWIALLCALFMVGTMGMSTMAESVTGDRLKQRMETLENRQQRLEDLAARNKEKQARLASKHDEYKAFRQSLNENRQETLKNRESNIALSAQTNALRRELAKKLKAIKESGQTLPEETIAKLKEYTVQIKEIADALRATKGDIREVMEKYKGFIKEKDYAAMDTAFEEIATIQTWRNEQLKQINELQKSMNALLDGITIPTTTSTAA